MYFHYIASQADGKVIEGDLEARDSAAVLEQLATKGLKPISLKASRGVGNIGKSKLFGQKIKVLDKVFLARYLALMLKVGTDLFRAIDILISDFDKPVMKTLLIEIRSALERGQPLYSTFAKYPQYFSPVFVNLIKAGEASGNLEQVFDELTISLEKEQDLRQKIKSALAYPIILLLASILMLGFLVTFALPKIAGIFANSAIKPPPFSRVVFAVGIFLNQYMLYILGILIVVGFSLWYFFSKTKTGRKVSRRFLSKVPILNKVLKKIALQRFASTLGLLLKSGLPILDAIEITADAVGDDEIKDSLFRISREGIAKGLTVGDAFRRETVFPRAVVNLMAISEKAGHIEDVLDTLSGFYEAEIESSVKILITFLEPAMLLMIGTVIGTIALSIIVPVYQLVGQY